MSWIAKSPSSFVGQSVGTGQCVAYVEQAAGVPNTAQWKRGALVKGSVSPQGTAIATFDANGSYGNHTDGKSHAAIFHEELPEGLLVWDQWKDHPVAPRVLHFRAGKEGLPCDDGDQFYVIEHA
jgi:hypothetical protein